MITIPRIQSLPRFAIASSLLAALSLILAILAAVWPVSWVPADTRAEIALKQGCLTAWIGNPRDFDFRGPGFHRIWVGGPVWTPSLESSSVLFVPLSAAEKAAIAPVRPTSKRIVGLFLRVPLYFPAALFLALAVLLFVPTWRRRFREQHGLCSNCGYDLRGSHDRCPECGSAASGGGITAAPRREGAERF